MEIDKIRSLGPEDMKTQAAQAGEQLFRIRFQKALGNTDGLKKLRGLKLDLARIKTVVREQELAESKAKNPLHINVAPAPSKRTARKQEKKASR